MRYVLPLILLVASPALAAGDAGLAERAAAHLALRAMDRRLETVADRLVSANEPFCRATVARTGLLLHDLSQYPDAPAARAAFGLGFAVAVAVAAASGPARDAGAEPGDALLSVAVGEDAEQPLPDRAIAARAIIDAAAGRALASGIPLHLRGLRGIRPIALTLAPRPACASRFQVAPARDGRAGADGTIVTIGPDLIAAADSEDALAAIVAHELAHNILGHAARIAAARDRVATIRLTEDEADRTSIWLLANAGYDPDAAIAFWTARASRRIDFGSATHRPWRDRIALMKQERAALSGSPLPARPPLLAFEGSEVSKRN